MTRSRPRRRIEIGWFEATVLMCGYVASLAIVGVAGIYIGERSVRQRLGAKERILRFPVPAEGRSENAARDPNITFYDTLGQPEEPLREGRVIVPGKEQSPQGAAAKHEPAKQARAEPPAARKEPGAAPTQAVAKAEAPPAKVEPPKPSPEAPVVAPTPTPSRETAPSPPPGVSAEAAATARALLGENAPRSGAAPTGTWSVQVNATQDGTTARELSERLRKRGYDAFVVTQVRDGETWYRVRVGRLPTLEMAHSLVMQLKDREGLRHAFVASD